MKTIDYTNIYNKYKGQWIALEDDEVTVISAGQTAKKVLELAKKKGMGNPILFKVPEEII